MKRVVADTNIQLCQWCPRENIAMFHANSCASPSSLAGIALACLRRKPTTLTLASKATELDWHDLHVNAINEASPIRLKSLRSHTRGAWERICAISEDRSTNAWITPSGKHEWDACRLPSASHVWDQGDVYPGMRARVTLGTSHTPIQPQSIYTIICLKSVCLSPFANCRSQFLLDRLGKYL